MSDYPCELIEDLLPLYAEGDLSNSSKEIVEDHLNECEKCRALLNEYSKDELKIVTFEETLPNADTFKKWMKRLRFWGIALITITLTIFIAIGTMGYKFGESSKNNLLTSKSIVKIFKEEGITLKKDNSVPSDDYILEKFTPSIYKINGTEDKLLIYIFDSFMEREKIINNKKIFAHLNSLRAVSYNAKNAFLVHIPAKFPETEAEANSMYKTITSIEDTVFNNLNEGKERIYTGESENWEGTFKVKYYEHWFKDEKGITHYESYNNTYPSLKYKNSDISGVGEVLFSYEAGSSGGSSSGVFLNKDGYIDTLASGGGTGSFPKEDEEIKFTINWNAKEENMILKTK